METLSRRMEDAQRYAMETLSRRMEDAQRYVFTCASDVTYGA